MREGADISERIRVVLADDHPTVRAGIRHFLNTQDDIQVIGEAKDGQQALNLVGELEPDILVLDMQMPNMDGHEVVRHLNDEDSPVRVLVLSAYTDWGYVTTMFAYGVAGYLAKAEAPEHLVHAVRKIAAGEKAWMSQRVSEHLAARGVFAGV